MRFRSLGSGSSGNATLIEASQGGRTTRVLVDCGMPRRELEARLLQSGLEANALDAVFITHEHADHIGCAVALCRKHEVALYMSRGTFVAVGEPDLNGLLQFASDGAALVLGSLRLLPYTVPHDAREPLQLRIDDGQRTLGLVTDLGHVSRHVQEHLQQCHALLLECNHDTDMLQRSHYPPFLKARIGGRFGHLCNSDAAQLAKAINHADLGIVVAAHLSEHNNRPELACAALSQALDRAPDSFVVADPRSGTPWLQA